MNPVDPKDQTGFNVPAHELPSANSSGSPFAPAAKPAPDAASTQHPIAPVPSNIPKSSVMPVMDESNPQVAEDNDLIEQEWVDKAKAIVEHTKQDPYKQNIEMNKMKADYIKKRYGKEIKEPNE